MKTFLFGKNNKTFLCVFSFQNYKEPKRKQSVLYVHKPNYFMYINIFTYVHRNHIIYINTGEYTYRLATAWMLTLFGKIIPHIFYYTVPSRSQWKTRTEKN